MSTVYVGLAVPIELIGKKLIVHADKIDMGYRLASMWYEYKFKEEYSIVSDPISRIVGNAALGFDGLERMVNWPKEVVLYLTDTKLSFFYFCVYMAKIVPENVADVYKGYLDEGKFEVDIPANDIYAVNSYLIDFSKKANEIIKK